MPEMDDAQTWLNYGIEKGWVRGFCATHDIYENADEIEGFEEGWDPCVPLYRIIGLDGNTSTNLGLGFLQSPTAKTNGRTATPARTTKKH